MTDRILVVALAFACEPGRGSEPGVGFAFARALAELSTHGKYEVVLLTRPHRADETRRALDIEFPDALIHVEPISIPRGLVWTTGRKRVRLAYMYWQLAAVSRVRSLIDAEVRPVLVHHLTFASDVTPTFEWLLPRGTVRLFGPTGSSQALNRDLWTRRRRFLDGQLRDRLSRANLRGVKYIIAQNEAVALELSARGAARLVVEPNILLSESEVWKALQSAHRKPYSLVCAGGLIERKQPMLALEVLALLPETYRLTFVGDGPLRHEILERAATLGILDRVTLTGDVSHGETLRLIAESTHLLHPSRQEGSGWVVGEAQALGAWPVVLEGSGADTTVRLGGLGSVVNSDGDVPTAMAQAVLASTLQHEPSRRWDASRMPALLRQWYEGALQA